MAAVTVFFALLAWSGGAEVVLFPIVQNGSMGYINSNGAIVIPPKFSVRGLDRGDHFAEGLEPASEDRGTFELIGYIDAAGTFVIPPQFTFALPFSEGLGCVRATNNQYGYIDRNGRFVIPPRYEDPQPFSDGLAMAGTNHLWGYIDRTGAWVIPPHFQSYSPASSAFRNGMACVETNGKWGFINKKGLFGIPPRFAQPGHFSDGLAVVREGDSYGYIDRSGKYVIEPRFDLAWEFSEGRARVEIAGRMAFIDKAGKTLFTIADGQWANPFREGLAAISLKRPGGAVEWGYIDRAGKFVIEPKFVRAEDFRLGLAQVGVSNQLAYIDRTGRFVWGPHGWNEAFTASRPPPNEPDRLKVNAEVLRLAALIRPANPPITQQNLDGADIRSETFQGLEQLNSPEARALLHALLNFTAAPNTVAEWGEIAQEQENSIRVNAAHSLVNLGDVTVIPVLRQWFNEGVSAAEAHKPASWGRFAAAIQGLGEFQDRKIIPVLLKLCDSGALTNVATQTPFQRRMMAGRAIERAALLALANMPAQESKDLLGRVLAGTEPVDIERFKVAAALVRLGEPSGRTFLLHAYDLYRAALDSRDRAEQRATNAAARTELELLGDTSLIETLRAKAEMLPRGIAKNNANTLVEEMRINALDADELRKIVAGNDMTRKFHAIDVLGRTGGKNDIALLESVGKGPRAGINGTQQQMLAGIARRAIHRIRQRTWTEDDLR